MQYTELGSTGLKVSRLGFGAMRLPMKDDRVDRELAIPLLHRAFEGGLNYVDSAVGYCNQDSQRAVGDALKGWRDKIVVSTKNPYYGEDEKAWWQNLEDSLERLQVEQIDVYNTHGVNWKRFTEAVEPRVGKWLTAAKDQGLIKHICSSFHDDCAALIRIVDAGFYESITLQYNLLDRQLEDGIAHAREKGVGIVVMGPVAGGRLGTPNETFSHLVPGIERIPELALRFVLSNSNVDVALSGMSDLQQVEENLPVASGELALNAEELGLIDEQLERLKNMADTYCTGCGYCLPCPESVDIPKIFKLYNDARVYGFADHSRQRYGRWAADPKPSSLPADACVECAACEDECPQDIPIRNQLKEAHAFLTGE